MKDAHPTVRALERKDLPAVLSLMRELSETAHTDVTFSIERMQAMYDAMSANPDS